jgi:hypothetical protein|nr:MAG TPA: hypothetical protein [Caudoviricetes sp.]
MKRLAKVVMMVALVGFAFNAHADDKMDKAIYECAHAAHLYDIRHGDGTGYKEIIFDMACKQKALIPFLDKEIVKARKIHEKYEALKAENKDPEVAEVFRHGEIKGHAIHNRINAGAA